MDAGASSCWYWNIAERGVGGKLEEEEGDIGVTGGLEVLEPEDVLILPRPTTRCTEPALPRPEDWESKVTADCPKFRGEARVTELGSERVVACE